MEDNVGEMTGSHLFEAPPQRPVGLAILPALAACAYPFLLMAFHHMVGPPGSDPRPAQIAIAALILLLAFCVPVLGMVCAFRPSQPTAWRRLAYASVAVPTLYVFFGVAQTMIGSPLPDQLVWCIGWLAAAALVIATKGRAPSKPAQPVLGRWRVVHGIVAAVLVLYVLFHLFNHLFGLIGPGAWEAVADVGRKVYRAPVVQPLLVLLMLFQVTSGGYLAWRWSAVPVGFHRLCQIASGVYLSAYILGHMNSVFLYARADLHIQTGWDFATGAPAGLIHDAWNIRLLPHYALGVFFVLMHLASGLRGVMLAHGVNEARVNRFWTWGVIASAVVATAILAGMCGVRV